MNNKGKKSVVYYLSQIDNEYRTINDVKLREIEISVMIDTLQNFINKKYSLYIEGKEKMHTEISEEYKNIMMEIQRLNNNKVILKNIIKFHTKDLEKKYEKLNYWIKNVELKE